MADQRGANPDPTTASGFELMVRRLLGLGVHDGLCEHCVYRDELDGLPSPCDDCRNWSRFERATTRALGEGGPTP